MFVIVVYEMVIFLKVPNHIEAAVVDLVEQVEHQVYHVLAIMAETIHSLIFLSEEKAKDNSSSAFSFCTSRLEITFGAHI